MINLIIDTSTDKPLVVFSRNEDILLNFYLPPGVHCSRTLMATIESGFKQLELSIASLKTIAVGVGPGSYTGIRVAAAAAYGLAFPSSLPLIGYCSLEGFMPSQDGLFASIIDARIGGAYVLLQQKEGECIYQRGIPQFIAKEELETFLECCPVIVGPHIGYPDPKRLATLANQRFAQGKGSSHLELIYLRTPNFK